MTTERDGESVLEEIYYFEVGTGPAAGMGYHRVYSSDDRPVDVVAEVRSGDLVLVPYGWHGPSMAVPGYDMYYLNVMAGPARSAHGRSATTRRTPGSAVPGRPAADPRLPMTGRAADLVTAGQVRG